MDRFTSTNLSPPGVISYFVPTAGQAFTNARSDVSLQRERIRSVFMGAERELVRYQGYGARWDGYRAKPFTPGVLGNAAKILSFSQDAFLRVGVIPDLVTTGPASDGSVDVEFRVATKRVIMTLYPQEEQLRLSSFDDTETHEHLAALGSQTLEDWLTWLNKPSTVPNDMEKHPSHSG